MGGGQADHLDPALGEPGIALSVMLDLPRAGMGRAIDLDRQSAFGAEEVENVRTDGMLASELEASRTATLQLFP